MPEHPIGWSLLLRQATGLVLFELVLVLVLEGGWL